MSQVYLTRQEIENLFQDQTIKILGYSTAPINGVPQNQDKVRITYPQTGQPAFKITDDLAFISVYFKDDAYNRQFETQYTRKDNDTAIRDILYTQAMDIKWTFYGLQSFDRADLVRAMIFQTPYSSAFKASNLCIIPDIAAPTRTPEYFNGQWWERADFAASFYQAIKRETETPYLVSAEITTTEG